jgi:hypothetical protein
MMTARPAAVNPAPGRDRAKKNDGRGPRPSFAVASARDYLAPVFILWTMILGGLTTSPLRKSMIRMVTSWLG